MIYLPRPNKLRPPSTQTYEVGPSTLEGRVTLSGAKNSAIPLLAASLATRGTITLENFPGTIADAEVMTEMLQRLGKSCRYPTDDSIEISESEPLRSDFVWSGRSIRNTLLLLGVLTGRTGYASVPLPGGCAFGRDRGHDLHVMLLEQLGAHVWEADGHLHAEVPNGLYGAEIHLPIRSTGVTLSAILAGLFARGVTTLWNPHVRPEVSDLVSFLNRIGADIQIFGQERIVIRYSPQLGGGRHRIIPDNMEALTWLIGGVVTGGEVWIDAFPAAHLEIPLIFLRESGAKFAMEGEVLHLRGGKPYPIEISTGPYPGINSDMQPLFATFALAATGLSKIVDLRFPDRYGYAREFAKLGSDIRAEGNFLHIHGGRPLTGATVRAVDLRAGAALVLAAMMSAGETRILDAWQVERGYDRFVEKATALGANLKREYAE